jgi:hypothetical protein
MGLRSCLAWLTLAPTGLLACSEESLTPALDQPLRVEAAQFLEGKLPGLPPLSREETAAGLAPMSPHVTSLDITGLSIVAGEGEKTIRGRVTTDAWAVALRFADAGSGYWILPVSGPDPINNGEYTFSLSANVSPETRPGYHSLLFAAIAEDGRSGTQISSQLCVGSPVPDNLNACEPTREPPTLVVSLGWDRDVDLDLQVLAPNGKLVDAKHPTTDRATPDHDPDPEADGVGVLDRDSNAGCQIDSLRRENLVFARRPLPGRYRVHASLFQACGEASSRFKVSLHSQVAGPLPDTFGQVVTAEKNGILLASQADGGSKLGLYVTEFVVE